ncbi:MAG TPA: phosphoribosyl-ATP diphosphatase [Xanthobacteraceae bacterium]|jgi:phosphoribosyl-ATP pyrophosphohydrolase|nr:phosphoribosyl-ATP diphosphatase [Xanthobacteraceae bacterium]
MSARLARTSRIERLQQRANRKSTGPDQAALNEMNAAPAMLVALPPAWLDPQAGQPAGSSEIERLHDTLPAVTPESHPRTAKLLGSGTRKVAQKVIEEAGEVALEAVRRNNGGVARESADLLYHLVVLWRRLGIDPAEIWSEMRRRADAMGIAEKLPKARHRNDLPG